MMKSVNLNLLKVSCFVFTTAFAFVGFSQSALALTGTCGLVASMPHPEMDWYAYAVGNGATITKNMDVLAEINFTTNSIKYSVTQFTWTTNGPSVAKTTVSGSATFTITGPNLVTGDTTPSSYQISFTDLNGKPIKLNVLPVNSGKTFLIQGIADRVSGVCQAF